MSTARANRLNPDLHLSLKFSIRLTPTRALLRALTLTVISCKSHSYYTCFIHSTVSESVNCQLREKITIYHVLASLGRSRSSGNIFQCDVI